MVSKEEMQLTVFRNRVKALCAREDDGSGAELLDSPWFPLKDTALHVCRVLHWVGKVDAYFDSTPVGVKAYGLLSEEFAEAVALLKEGESLMIRFTVACRMIVPGSIEQQQRLIYLFEGSRVFALQRWRTDLQSTFVEIQWNQTWYLAFVEAYNVANNSHKIIYEQGQHADKIIFCPKAVAIKFRPKNGRCEVLTWRPSSKIFDPRARPPPLHHLVKQRVALRGPEHVSWPIVVTSLDPVTDRFRAQHTDSIDSDSFYFTHDHLAIRGDGKEVYEWKPAGPGRGLPSNSAPEVSAAAPDTTSLVSWAKDRVKQIEAFQTQAYAQAKRSSVPKPSTIGLRTEAREAISTELTENAEEQRKLRSAAGTRARLLEASLFERNKFSERLPLDRANMLTVLQYIRDVRQLQDVLHENEKMRTKALSKKCPTIKEFLDWKAPSSTAALEKLTKISKTDKTRDKIAKKVEQAEAKAKDLEEALGNASPEVEDPARVAEEQKEREKVEDELDTIIATEKETRAALPSFGDVEVRNETFVEQDVEENSPLKRPREETSVAAEFSDIAGKRIKGFQDQMEVEGSGSVWRLGLEPLTEMMEWTGRFKKDTMMCDVRVCMMEEDYGIALPSRRVKITSRLYRAKQLKRSMVLNVLPTLVEPSGTIRVAKVLDYVNNIRLSASEREIFLATMHLRARDPAAQLAFQALEEEGRAAVVDRGSDMIIYIIPMALAKPGFLSGAPRPKSQPLALVVLLLRPGNFPTLCHAPVEKEREEEVVVQQVQKKSSKATGMSAQSLSLLRQPDAISKLQEQLRMLTRKS